MDFIFMLTRGDETVKDCLELFDAVRPLGLAHVGFKDVGVDAETLHALNRRIKESGATSYLEVVSTTPAAGLRSAAMAVEIGVDRLLGAPPPVTPPPPAPRAPTRRGSPARPWTSPSIAGPSWPRAAPAPTCSPTG